LPSHSAARRITGQLHGKAGLWGHGGRGGAGGDATVAGAAGGNGGAGTGPEAGDVYVTNLNSNTVSVIS
jgi:hypothetical protein